MIVLDFETNTNEAKDVLEVGALKIEKQGKQYVVVDTFHRYYYSKFQMNYHTLQVHNLFEEVIAQKRKGVSYETYFANDKDFTKFCKGCNTLIAHNVTFEKRYIDDMASFKHYFCTMAQNKRIVNAKTAKGGLKNPTLLETCKHYNIKFDNNKYHSAIYDAEMALAVLNKMNCEENEWDVVGGTM